MRRAPALATAAPVEVRFLVLPQTLLLDLAGPAEAFRLANQALQRRGRPPAFRLRHMGPLPEVTSSVGLKLSGLAPLPARLSAPSWVLLLGRPGEVGEALRPSPAWLAARDWLARQMPPVLAAGAASPHRLITVCLGALLAADAGLLAGRRCTTHHELLEGLQRLAPTARVEANQLWVEDGALLTSAGITAGTDLALHLIAGRCGAAVAAAVAQVMCLPSRRAALAPQRSPLLNHRDHLHPGLHRVQDAVGAEPAADWSAARLAALAHVTPRHLARLFVEHTGLTPRAWVAGLRASIAQQAMQDGASAAQAASVAGYASARQWRRVRQRATCAPPPAGEAAADEGERA